MYEKNENTSEKESNDQANMNIYGFKPINIILSLSKNLLVMEK